MWYQAIDTVKQRKNTAKKMVSKLASSLERVEGRQPSAVATSLRGSYLFVAHFSHVSSYCKIIRSHKGLCPCYLMYVRSYPASRRLPENTEAAHIPKLISSCRILWCAA